MTHAQLMRVLRAIAHIEGYLLALEKTPEWIIEELGEVQDIVQAEMARIAGEELK